MAKDTIDYSLGDLHARIGAMEKTVDALATQQGNQQRILDKADGAFRFIKWAVSGIGILQVISIISQRF